MSLDALAFNAVPGVSVETVVETVWAITHFVYTNDNEVNFVRRYPQSPRLDEGQAHTTIRSFLVNRASKPAEIAKFGCEAIKDEPRQLRLDPSAPKATQLVRKVALLVTEGDEQVSEHGLTSQDKVRVLTVD